MRLPCVRVGQGIAVWTPGVLVREGGAGGVGMARGGGGGGEAVLGMRVHVLAVCRRIRLQFFNIRIHKHQTRHTFAHACVAPGFLRSLNLTPAAAAAA